MAPQLVRPPFHRNGWVYEEKVDGWRMLAYKDGTRVRLISRNGVDHTLRFRELAAAVATLHADVLVVHHPRGGASPAEDAEAVRAPVPANVAARGGLRAR